MELIGSLSTDHSLTHRKVTLEITRSFPEICGYNITSIRDVPIATSGMLDDLGRSKFPPGVFRNFNGDAVLVQAWDLARAWVGGDRVMSGERYNFYEGGAYSVRILLSNFTGSDFHSAEFCYRLSRQGETLLEGKEEVRRILPHAQVSEVSYLNFRLPDANQPDTLVLEVSLRHNSKLIAQNDFPIFIYPYKELQYDLPVFDPGGELEGLTRHLKMVRSVAVSELSSIRSNVLMSSCLTSEVRLFTENGGRLLLLQRGQGGLPTRPGPMWREGMIRPFAHPILKGIEKATWYDDLRYFSMTAYTSIDSQTLDGIGAFDIVPVIKRYDCRNWGSTDYLCAFRLGKGICAASTLRFGGGLGKTPLYAKHNPFALYLFTNMLGYLRNV
jgi:hypothetical protein